MDKKAFKKETGALIKEHWPIILATLIILAAGCYLHFNPEIRKKNETDPFIPLNAIIDAKKGAAQKAE